MVGLALRSIAILAFGLVVSSAGLVQADQLIPAKRLSLSQNTDLPGGDLSSIFDTTLNACETACLTNPSCEAMTFNTNNGSCFLKQGAGDPVAFDGAYSGVVLQADPGAEDLARLRRADLTFLPDWDISAATYIAADMDNRHVTDAYTAEEHLASAAEAEGNGDFAAAFRYTGAALNVADTAENWTEYARLLLAAAQGDQDNAATWRDDAFRATINAYLRADDPALQHSILVQMAQALESIDRGRDMVQALRLAQSLQPRDDTAAMLDDAAGKYGFRVLDNQVQTETNRPRVCVSFSEDLVATGVDYASFVKLPEPGLSVALDGARQLCVEGISYGTGYKLTFRKGLPAATGETLLHGVTISAYIRDRAPSVHFAGRGYVLPRTGTASIPVVTVNTGTLDLELWKVTDRNLLRSLQDSYFNQPMYFYQEQDFKAKVGSKLWSGTATVGADINQDITTRLPLDEAIAGQPAGIYALRATVPHADPYGVASWQWFVVSDLGLTTMSGVDGLHVFVHALGDAMPKAGVDVQLLSSANEVLGTATTDDQGHALFDAGFIHGMGSAAPAMIVARDGETDQAFLSLTDPEFDLSDRGVEGAEAPPPVDVFLTTDRGAYRAGETVHATALTRDAQQAAITGLPLTGILTRPDGVEYVRALADDAGAGGHVFDFPIADTAPRGRWSLSVYSDLDAPALSAKSFLVEDFLPERIDVKLGLDDAPLTLGAVPQVSVDAAYLFGAPAADLAVEGEVMLRAAQGVQAWPAYSFGRFDASFDMQITAFAGARTDAAGHAVINAALPQVQDPLRPLEAVFVTRVSEGSGRPVERKVTKPLAPSTAMIGIKPMFDGVVAENAEARFDLVGVGTDEHATAMAVHWELTRIDTTYQWYQINGSWNWQPVTTRTRMGEGEAKLSARGPSEIAAPVTWGEYELSVTRSDGQAAVSSVKFYAGWYAPADVTSTPDSLPLSLDKPSYAVGDTAMLRIVPRAAGTALVTVLSNAVVSHIEVPVTEGENLIPVPVTDDWGTGAYVTAEVLRPMDVAAGRNPARALGLAYAKIDPGTRALTATIETAPEAAPRGPIDIAVKVDGVAQGDEAYVTVAAVDVGILNLTGYTPPDPQGHYFGQRKLGVGLRDLYGRLIDGLNGAQGEVRSGGDAGANARLQAPPPTEQLVANFAGPVQVDADGYAHISFDLPAFNGTVKVMAVAWSKRGVGQASTDVLVRDPVVVTASLPRFLQPGDESRLRLEIVHAMGPAGDMGLSVTSSGLILGDVPDSVTLTDKGSAVVEVPVTADALGLQMVEVTLTTPDGKVLTKDLTLPVQVNDPMIARVSRFDLAKGQSFTFDSNVFAGLSPTSAKAVMAIGPIARLNAPGVMAALDAYPYGCTEQITSKAMPLLYFDQVAQALDLPGAQDIQGRVTQAIADVLTNQDASGAFGLWVPMSGDMWLDAYVTDFLSRAKAQGYEVPDRAFRQALDNLRNQVNYYADFDKGG
ncbi:MAG: alpha-2-macroglobulin family protein, partial [Pseudomonadota bacterium]